MRTYAELQCPKCGGTPKRTFEGKLLCDCGGSWVAERGERGKPEEHAQLINAGFVLTTDTNGDVYYVGPYIRIVWLFADGTWRSEPRSDQGALDEYLKDLRASAAAV